MKKLSAEDLAQLVDSNHLTPKDYDFASQQRWQSGDLVAGLNTMNSVQTFDYAGKPMDARSDNND